MHVIVDYFFFRSVDGRSIGKNSRRVSLSISIPHPTKISFCRNVFFTLDKSNELYSVISYSFEMSMQLAPSDKNLVSFAPKILKAHCLIWPFFTSGCPLLQSFLPVGSVLLQQTVPDSSDAPY